MANKCTNLLEGFFSLHGKTWWEVFSMVADGAELVIRGVAAYSP